jgi:uncharacterized membrane-anchored protein
MVRLLIAALVLPLAAAAQKLDVQWTPGPDKAELGEASLQIPDSYVFTGREGTQRVMKYTGNLLTNQEVGMIMPAPKPNETRERWFVVFEYSPIGHVKDDERDSIDADAILKMKIEAGHRANEQRAKQGLATLDVVGWAIPPHYDINTHNLEWGLTLHAKQGEQDQGEVVNYEVRLLGREGVMRTTLVIDPAEIQTALPEFRAILKGFAFSPGRKYAEFRQGDRVAQVGLTALIAGGAVAVAAKSGLLKYLWKLLVVGGAAAVAALRRLFGREKVTDPPSA